MSSSGQTAAISTTTVVPTATLLTENTLKSSSVYLSVFCAIFIVVSFLFNFTFLITLLKLRRLNRVDKSNLLLTHLIFADFFCAFFILIPSGYGIYSLSQLSTSACHLQLYFITFFFSLTLYGMLALSVERYFKFKYPISHINFFTQRDIKLSDESLKSSGGHKYVVYGIVFALWLLNIFISFIPLFGNYSNVQYFAIESQCDYIYEKFSWWLWLYFWVSIVIPFVVSLVFYLMTIRLIVINARIIEARKNIIRSKNNQKEIKLSTNAFLCEMLLSCVTRRRKVAENVLKAGSQMKINKRGFSDTTKLPDNTIYYSHIINIQNIEDEEHGNRNNDMHVRKQLLITFKYDTERSKTMTFLIITILSFCFIFPVYVIHFYRIYHYDASFGSYDNPSVVSFPTYTAFVWISYLTLFLKSLVCLIHNKHYRYSLYQSANCRGFHGIFEYEIQRLKKDLEKLEEALDIDLNRDGEIGAKAKKKELESIA